MTTLERSYVAGFFDGEGSITIHENYRPSPRGKAPNHTLQVAIGNTDPRVLVWLHAAFGGNLCPRRAKHKRRRNMLQWTVRTAQALVFLEAIRPFVRMKRDQVDIAIAYQKTKYRRGPRTLTRKTIAWREAQRQSIRALNARAWIH